MLVLSFIFALRVFFYDIPHNISKIDGFIVHMLYEKGYNELLYEHKIFHYHNDAGDKDET